MKHLILGSSGQIGFHLVSYLKSVGEEVIEFDIVESSNQDLRIYNNNILEQAINECDFVHFLAFDIGGSLYMEKYQDTFGFIDNNIKIMDRTFDLLKKYNKPFIFASSQMSNMSYSTYGILKAIGEKYTESLNGLVVKFWNVYGYEKDEEKSHVITDFIKMAQRKEFGPSTASLVAAAEARDIPWLRLNNYSLVQFGHGKFQQRIQATITSETKHQSNTSVKAMTLRPVGVKSQSL